MASKTNQVNSSPIIIGSIENAHIGTKKITHAEMQDFFNRGVKVISSEDPIEEYEKHKRNLSVL